MIIKVDLLKVCRALLSRFSRGIALRYLDRCELDNYYKYKQYSEDIKSGKKIENCHELKDNLLDFLMALDIEEISTFENICSKIFITKA
tara:strand:+ start:239 stop:505 length:267 start_codon:yes stop_codon:yes gene_type:complete